MAVSRIKTWSQGEVLTADELNAEIDNLNQSAVAWPMTANGSAAGYEIQNAKLATLKQLNDNVVTMDNYASFAAAITAIGSTVTTLLINANVNVTANATVPSTCTLWFLGQGKLTVSVAVTCTINGPIIAAPRQIFAGSGTVAGLQRCPHIYPQWWGAVGDGSTDDVTALQAALDMNRLVTLPPGKYRTTTELIIDPIRNRNAGFIGHASWSNYSYTLQTGGPTWDGTKESIIYYDGSTSSTTAIIRASADAVGTEPASTFANNVYGLKIHNVLLDGNSKAGFGFYGVRLMEPDVCNVAVRGTTQHAWYIVGNYSGKFSKISAVFNSGCGISVGRATLDYSWVSISTVNATVFDDLYATTNGGDKAFDETTNSLWGYGIGLWLHRGNVVTHYTSELNDGPALVLGPTSGPNVIHGGYSELSSGYSVSSTTAIADGRASRAWGIWFVGQTGAVSLANSIQNVFSAAEGIRLTGTAPSSGRPEQALELSNLSGFNYLNADWGGYRLINPSLELAGALNGTLPVGSWQILGGINLGLEQAADLSAPGTGEAVLYLKDNGSSKTQLCVRFATGAVQVLATEP